MAPWFEDNCDFELDSELSNKTGKSFPHVDDKNSLGFAIEFMSSKDWTWTTKQQGDGFCVTITHEGSESYAECNTLNRAIYACIFDALCY